MTEDVPLEDVTHVRLDRGDDGVATVELDRRRRLNALDRRTIAELRSVVDALAADPPAAVLLASTSERAFSVGLDFESLPDELGRAEARAAIERTQETFTDLATLETPVVGAIRGHALGGGLELALCADLRIAGESATFAQPEIDHGLPPGGGATQRLPAVVGEARAREMIFTGRRYDAETAERWGLVNQVVADDEVVPRARDLAADLAASPRAAFATATAAMRARRGGDDDGFAIEAAGFTEQLLERHVGSPDADGGESSEGGSSTNDRTEDS